MLRLKVMRAPWPIVVACALWGCSGVGTGVGASPFDGTYTGTYSGSDSGTVQMQVANGNVTVSATSTLWKTTYTGSGQVTDSGELLGGASGGGGTVDSGPITIRYGGISISFSGSISNGTATGSWSSSNSAGGTWVAHDE
jgi:hypothetical protein